MLRKKGIIGLIVFIAIFFVLSLIFTDAWLEARMEDAGSAIVGAKVEFDDVDLSIFSVKLSWDRLQVTDPKNTMKNMVETGKCDFDMEFWPLLSGKVIVENFALTNIRTNTDRTTDGKIEKPEKSEKSGEPGFIENTSNKLEDEVKDEPVFQLTQLKGNVNVDSILSILKLTSPSKIQDLEKSFEERYAKWDSRLSGKDYEKQLNELQTKVKSIDPKNIKTIDKALAAAKTLSDIKKESENIINEAKAIKNDFVTDFNSTKDSIAQIDNWIKDDYLQALSLAKLPDINVENIGKMLFGADVVNRFRTYLGYAQTAREYSGKFSSKEEKEPDPPRLEGQNIHFYERNARPGFWVKKITINGMTDSKISFAGDAWNIVSNQKLINKTTNFEIGGKSEHGADMKLTGLFDYLKEVPNENFRFSLDGFSLNNTKLTKSKYLPGSIEKGTGILATTVDIKGNKIQGIIDFTSRGLVFGASTEKPGNKFEEIISEVIAKTDNINFKAILEGEGENIRFSIKSNLDQLLYNNLKAKLSGELEKAKTKLKAEIDKQVNKYKAEAEAENYINKQKAALEEKVGNITELSNSVTSLINSKNDEIEKKKTDLQNQGVNKLKDLLK